MICMQRNSYETQWAAGISQFYMRMMEPNKMNCDATCGACDGAGPGGTRASASTARKSSTGAAIVALLSALRWRASASDTLSIWYVTSMRFRYACLVKDRCMACCSNTKPESCSNLADVSLVLLQFFDCLPQVDRNTFLIFSSRRIPVTLSFISASQLQSTAPWSQQYRVGDSWRRSCTSFASNFAQTANEKYAQTHIYASKCPNMYSPPALLHALLGIRVCRHHASPKNLKNALISLKKTDQDLN